MSEPVLQLVDLVAMTAFYPNLINDVVKVTVLFLGYKRHLALAALHATLLQPLLYAVFVENLFAIGALD